MQRVVPLFGSSVMDTWCFHWLLLCACCISSNRFIASIGKGKKAACWDTALLNCVRFGANQRGVCFYWVKVNCYCHSLFNKSCLLWLTDSVVMSSSFISLFRTIKSVVKDTRHLFSSFDLSWCLWARIVEQLMVQIRSQCKGNGAFAKRSMCNICLYGSSLGCNGPGRDFTLIFLIGSLIEEILQCCVAMLPVGKLHCQHGHSLPLPWLAYTSTLVQRTRKMYLRWATEYHGKMYLNRILNSQFRKVC